MLIVLLALFFVVLLFKPFAILLRLALLLIAIFAFPAFLVILIVLLVLNTIIRWIV